MMSEEYRQVLGELNDQQRKDLNEHIYKGNQPTVDVMVHVFEKYADVEPKAVFWLTKNVLGFQHKTQADRAAEATIRSAELGEQSLAVSQKSLRAAYWALVIAVLALFASIVAICK